MWVNQTSRVFSVEEAHVSAVSASRPATEKLTAPPAPCPGVCKPGSIVSALAYSIHELTISHRSISRWFSCSVVLHFSSAVRQPASSPEDLASGERAVEVGFWSVSYSSAQRAHPPPSAHGVRAGTMVTVGQLRELDDSSSSPLLPVLTVSLPLLSAVASTRSSSPAADLRSS